MYVSRNGERGSRGRYMKVWESEKRLLRGRVKKVNPESRRRLPSCRVLHHCRFKSESDFDKHIYQRLTDRKAKGKLGQRA